jgi:hypothetical protein
VDAVARYLSGWAEPEHALASHVEARYERCLVVPVRRGDASFLDGYLAAAQTSRGRTLCIVIACCRDDASEGERVEAAELVSAVLARLKRVREVSEAPRAHLGAVQPGTLDALLVDRTTEGARVPPGEGTGLARKIGCDVAVALHAAGRSASRFVFCTDPGAVLPEAHFDQPDADDRPELSAMVFPFFHDAGADLETTRRTAFRELELRYARAGLEWAGSPYAFHSLGSAMAVAAPAYAAVRGAARRDAGEALLLLNKLAKVGPVLRAPSGTVHLRASGASPGEGGAAATPESARTLPAPAVFTAVKEVLARLVAFAEHGSVARFETDLDGLSSTEGEVVRATLAELDATTALAAASRDSDDAPVRLRRVHAWFDAVRTARILDALRERARPDLPWTDAVRAAPFCPSGIALDDAGLVPLRLALARAEQAAPMLVGPAR